MAVNIDSFTQWLGGLFGDEERLEEFHNDSEGVLSNAGFGNVNAVDVQQAMARLAETNQGNQSFTSQGGYADFSGSGVVNLPPPPPAYEAYEASGDGGGIAGAIESINHYTSVTNVTNQSYEDNDTTTINDQDTNIDNSVNQEITAFGDVTQDFDNDVVTGDRAVAAGDGSQVNTGDGSVQVGGNVTDATIATGDVGGSVTGDVSDSVVGNDNQVIDVDGPANIGPVAFGDGDAIEAENVNQGSGAIVDDVSGDVAVNTGAGDQAVVQDSQVSESSVGGGDVYSDDVNINASGDSAVAFGDGSTAEVDDIDIQGNTGTVQVAGDESIQQGITDNDFNAAIDVDVDPGYRPPVVLAEAAEAPEYYEDAPDDGAPTIDDSDTFNQNIDTDDFDGLD